jgi:phosphoglycerate dehydrogenase-like enzyme
MRNASIDMTAAKEHGITVCGTASGSEPPVELTWALILALAKKVVPENTAFKNDGPWQSNVTADLYGKNLGVIGLGKIGSKVAKVGLAFGMNVSAWSPNLMAETAQTIGIKFASSKENLLKDSDYVTIHLVLGERSRNLIAAEDLAAMKKSAFIVNTSRAAIINQQDLINALKNHRISGAAQDVFDTEPLPLGHELRRLPNFLGTPHLGYVSSANYKKYFGEAVENINAFLSGKAVKKLN